MVKAIDLDLGGRAVGAADISHALALAKAQARGEGREVLHALPMEITLDDSPRLRDARGMVGAAPAHRGAPGARDRRGRCTIFWPRSSVAISTSPRWSRPPTRPASPA